MAKLSFIIAALVLSLTIDYTTQDLPLTAGCKGNNSTCTSSTECCSAMCNGKCIPRCLPVNTDCKPGNDKCCDGSQCDKSTKRCCRLPGQVTLTPSECCSQQWIPPANGCGGICVAPCQPAHATCDKKNVCCRGLECNPSTKTCCRLPGQTALTPSECCTQQWIPNRNGCGGVCSSPCRPFNATCDQATDVCCNGLQCNQYTKRCCRLYGQTAQAQSECCSQSWKPNTDGTPGGRCCSQHATACSTDSDCCSSFEDCSNPQWPNICV